MPTRLRQDIPVVGFEDGEPLGLKWCNHARLAKNLTAAQCSCILQSRCPCEKHKHEFVGKGLIPPGCNHVVTCSPDILGDDCPQDLRDLFMFGPKHRPELLHVTMDASIREEVNESLDAGFIYFLEKSGNSAYSNWCQVAMQALKDQLQ